MVTVQAHLKLQIEEIKKSMPKQILEEDSSDTEDLDDSLKDPDYHPEGKGSDADNTHIDEPKGRKRKHVKRTEDVCGDVDVNNNTTEENSITDLDQNVASSEQNAKQCKRKRKFPKLWKSAVRKTKRNRGQE